MSSKAYSCKVLTQIGTTGKFEGVHLVLMKVEGESNVRYWIRQAPPDETARPRWTQYYCTDSTSDIELLTEVTTGVERKVGSYDENGNAKEFTIYGLWEVEASQQNIDELQSGVSQPNALFTKIGTAMGGIPPQNVPFPTMGDAIKVMASWIKMAGKGESLSSLTVAPEEAIGAEVEVADPAKAEPVVSLSGIPHGFSKPGGPMRVIPVKVGNSIIKFGESPLKDHPNQTNLDAVLRGWTAGKLVLLYGPPGTGKTLLALAAAQVWKPYPLPVFRVMGSGDLRHMDLVGSNTIDKEGNIVFSPRELTRAVTFNKTAPENGGAIFLLDEGSLPSQEALTAIWALQDIGILPLNEDRDNPHCVPIIPDGFDEKLHGSIEDLPRGIPSGEDFAIVITINPDVAGGHIAEPLLSRSEPLRVVTDYELALKLLGPAFERLVRLAANMGEKYANGEITTAPQWRDLAYAAEIAKRHGGMEGMKYALGVWLNQYELGPNPADGEVLKDSIIRMMGIPDPKGIVIS